MSQRTTTILYGIFVTVMVLFVCIAYARVTTELKVEGEGDATEQQGIYITDVAYLTDNEADQDNSTVNFFLGTMLDSKVTLGSSSSSSLSYKVTVKNNTDREQVFIGIVKDETNETIYSNTNIQPNVATVGEIAGLEEYVTIVASGETLTFPVTFAYSGTDTSNPELQSKINFRFREKPILELSNNGEIYTLENIYAGYTPAEYEFTVSNYNQNYTNGVPLTYTLVPTITEGSPLTAKIYDANGAEITESISIAGDGTAVDHTYTLKILWDSTLDSIEYEGQAYTCELKLTAIPDTTVDADLDDYAEYKIEQGFKVEITTNTKPTVSAVASNIEATETTIVATGSDGDGDTLQYTLEINGQIYEPSTTNTWNVTGLSPDTTYTYTVTVSDGKESVSITNELTTKILLKVSIDVSNITTTGATITATVTDANVDTIQYTLKVNGQTYGPDTTNTWTISNLEQYTNYAYTVKVTAGTSNVTTSGEFTTLCPHFYVDYICAWCGCTSIARPGVRVPVDTPYTSGSYTATIPAGFTVSGVASEQSIEDGLVIYLIPEGETVNWSDGAAVATAQQTYDQFVWIPVDDINDMYMCKSEDGTNSCRITVADGEAKCTTHNSNQMAGRIAKTEGSGGYVDLETSVGTFTSQNGEPTALDEFKSESIDYDADGIDTLNDILGDVYASVADFGNDLQDEYNLIVKSVYENNGFYIGRYEAAGAFSDPACAVSVVSGADIAEADWYVLYANLRNFSVNLGLSCWSTMVQGAAFCQVLRFVNTTDFNVFSPVNVSHDLSETYQTGGLNYNGSIPYADISKNIYDLEGNLRTATTTSWLYSRATFGGSFDASFGARVL